MIKVKCVDGNGRELFSVEQVAAPRIDEKIAVQADKTRPGIGTHVIYTVNAVMHLRSIVVCQVEYDKRITIRD